eukprot:3817016-Amphidinium_carterae.1
MSLSARTMFSRWFQTACSYRNCNVFRATARLLGFCHEHKCSGPSALLPIYDLNSVTTINDQTEHFKNA